jgi:hypothetical protein
MIRGSLRWTKMRKTQRSSWARDVGRSGRSGRRMGTRKQQEAYSGFNPDCSNGGTVFQTAILVDMS